MADPSLTTGWSVGALSTIETELMERVAGWLRLREGWLMVGLLALMLFSVTWSVQRAEWAEGLRSSRW